MNADLTGSGSLGRIKAIIRAPLKQSDTLAQIDATSVSILNDIMELFYSVRGPLLGPKIIRGA